MTKNNQYTIPLLFCFALSCFGCTTIKQPDTVFSQPDYTEQDVRQQEIKRIEAMRPEDPVQALWRACLLGDSAEMDNCFKDVVSEYTAAVDKKDWFDALRYYRSLKAAGYSALSSLEKNEESLNALSLSGVPGINSVKKTVSTQSEKVRVASYISGTVTVWVDRGMKIENGVGYADRVIGSGFFISKNGYIVTNYHVIKDLVDTKSKKYAQLFIKLAQDNDTRIPAKVIGWDPVVDLALLKTEVDAPYVFSLGSSTDLSVGDRVFAIGSPVGLERTLTSGIVSATDRKLFTTGSVLQIDAAVNSGNSGGPCIDENGAVQAIVFAGMLQYEGLNFAIPVEYLKADLPALFHGGEYTHPWLAAYGHTNKSLGKDSGLEIQYIMPGGGASRAQLSIGDTIVSVDGEPVKSLEDFQNVLLHRTSGAISLIGYQTASGDQKKCLIYLDSRPKNPGYQMYQNDLITGSFIPIFGMKLLAASTSNNRKYSISEVIRGSVADESGFSENDPVEIQSVKFDDDNSVIYAQLYTKKRKKGYLDASMALAAPLDSPYYF